MQPTPPQPAGPTHAAAAPRRHPWIIGAALAAALAAALVLGRPHRGLAPEGEPARAGAAPAHVKPLTAQVREFEGSYAEAVAPTGVVREVALEAAPATLPLLDGRPLEVWAYNGQVPGPTIRVRRGDTLRVTFTNRLPQPTTVHWHGVRVPNAMDGVPGVTQPAVPPGGTFVYEFVPRDAGTFWFHPHLRSSEQVERGLYGVLIVEDPEPTPYSRDIAWVLDDWRIREGAIDPRFNTPHDLMHDGRWGNVITVNGSTDERLAVQPGERIRLRLLNAANGRVFAPDFSGLDARVIAVDGLYAARPLDPAGFELAPGNRIDLDITVPASTAGRQIGVIDRFTRRPNALASIDVSQGAAVQTPVFPSPATAHVPAWRDTDSIAPRSEYVLAARRGGELGIEWTLNGAAARHAHDIEAASGDGHAHEIAALPRGAFSKLRFVNDSGRLHPIHLHGMFFKVLSRDGRPADEPFFRDTVLVHPREAVDIGVVPLDEGRWMLHCHILEHAEAGMMSLLDVKAM
ncbi:multicopper oxidase family protein [Sorangium sp. So ce315]|uniref:multicopper oxidase family protein n=1 Tax=Sorangium sp. So ce315 TaxID=3133299 RepID=UPI003F600FB9